MMPHPLQQLARSGLLLGFSLCASLQASAQTFCVFDPLGTQGPAYEAAKDYRIEAKRWGAELELKAYTEERVVVEDFKAGQCDMAGVTGMRVRQFSQFTGSIDAVGGIETYAQMHELLQALASPKVEKYMVNGPYEIVGITPIGAGYAFVRDRSINTLAKATGKKIAVMDFDKTQALLVQQIGGQPVPSDLTSFAGKFNNGTVDIVVSPIIAYKPLELYRGLGSKGAIARFPIIQLTGQMLIRRDRFPAGFGQKSREYVYRHVDRAFGLIRNEENVVDPKHWMYVPRGDREGYTKIMREARIRLTADGFYDKRMMGVMKRVRCASEPGDAECSLNDE